MMMLALPPIRYAVSVVWKMDQNYDVKSDAWFGRTIIRSRYKLSYEVAQQLCDRAAASDIKGDIPELLNLDLSQQELEKRYFVCIFVLSGPKLHKISKALFTKLLFVNFGF